MNFLKTPIGLIAIGAVIGYFAVDFLIGNVPFLDTYYKKVQNYGAA